MADAGRVIAGTARGRRLVAPGEGTRPLADRVKQTLFAILEPDLPRRGVPRPVRRAAAPPGIEALSRGAARATFVERDRRALTTIAENLGLTGLAGPAAAARPGRRRQPGCADPAATDGPFDLVVVDPPYAETGLLVRLLAILGRTTAGRAARARRPGRRQALLARPSAGDGSAC